MSGTPRAGAMGEFADADALVEAVRRLRADGYARVDAFTPYPLDEVEEMLGLRGRTLPRWTLAAGIVGVLLGGWIQWYANAWDYPLNVGGRPLLSVPAWVPVALLTGVFFAAAAAFAAFLAAVRLPALWHPVFEVEGFEGASVDRFWVIVGADDPRYDPLETRRRLASLGAVRVASATEGG